jgi:ATP/ADP translocase
MEEMMKEDNERTGPRLNGCGWAALAVIVPLALAFALVLLFILFNFGAWLGGQ